MTIETRDEQGLQAAVPYRWRPSGCPETQKILGENGKELGEIYLGEQNGRFEAIAYHGKAARQDWYFTFRSRERLDAHVADYATRLRGNEAYKAARAIERKKPHDLMVGDVLSAMWGYDQTNVDYYQVTRVSDRCVWVRPIAGECVETGSMYGDCVPLPGAFLAGSKETRHVVNAGRVKIDNVRSASRVGYREVGGVKVYEVSHWSSYH